MILGVDIDDTINNCSEVMDKEVISFARKHNLAIVYNKEGYGCESRYGFSREYDELFWVEKGVDVYTKSILSPGAAEKLNSLKERGATLYVMSGRWECFKDITEHFLNSSKIPYDKVYLGLHQKDILAEELKLDGMFEDAETYLTGLRRVVPIIYVKEQLHNQNMRNKEGLVYFKNWIDLDI